VLLDEARLPDDRTGDEARVAVGGSREHLAERPAEHERLELQAGVDQPAGRETKLQRPPGVRDRPSRLFPRAMPAPPHGVARRDGDIAHRNSPQLEQRQENNKSAGQSRDDFR